MSHLKATLMERQELLHNVSIQSQHIQHCRNYSSTAICPVNFRAEKIVVEYIVLMQNSRHSASGFLKKFLHSLRRI